jgi:hypothetical protein
LSEIPIKDRKFTDEEVRQILKKAVEGTPSRALQERDGLSLLEIKAIGGEVGIDPDRIEDAARSLTLRGGPRNNPIVGAPTTLEFEAKVEGELGEEDTPEVLVAIRRNMGHQGTVTEIHGSLEWRVSGDVGERYVTVSSRDGVTTILGSSNLSQGALLSYLPAGILSLIAFVPSVIALLDAGNPLPLSLSFGAALLAYGGIRAVWKRVSAKETKKLQGAVAELARLAERSVGAGE